MIILKKKKKKKRKHAPVCVRSTLRHHLGFAFESCKINEHTIYVKKKKREITTAANATQALLWASQPNTAAELGLAPPEL